MPHLNVYSKISLYCYCSNIHIFIKKLSYITNPAVPFKSPTSSWLSCQSRLGLFCSSQPLKDKRVSSTFIQFNFCHATPIFIIHNILTKTERCTKSVFSNLKVPHPLIYLDSLKNQQMLPWQMNTTLVFSSISTSTAYTFCCFLHLFHPSVKILITIPNTICPHSIQCDQLT